MIPDDDNPDEIPCGPCLAGDAPIHVVADTVSKVEGRVYPMAFVLPDGESRVLHTVFGRNDSGDSHRFPEDSCPSLLVLSVIPRLFAGRLVALIGLRDREEVNEDES